MTEAEILAELNRDEALAPFRVESIETESAEQAGLDAVIRLSLDGMRRGFAVEVRSRSVRGIVLEGANRLLERIGRLADGELRPLLVCPYIRPDLAKELLARGVSTADLSGNVAVVVPQTWYVERLGKPNKYPEAESLKNPYRGTSSLVARVLVTGESFDTAKDLIERIERLGGSITKATVSKALSQLEGEGLVVRQPRIAAADRARLLDLLAANYRAPSSRRQLRGSVPELESWRRAASVRADETGLQLVGLAPERYADFPSSYEELLVYTDAAERLVRETGFAPGDRWSNLTVVETDEQTVYFDARAEDGFRWCPPLETYFTLATGGKRERETSEGLRKRLLTATPKQQA